METTTTQRGLRAHGPGELGAREGVLEQPGRVLRPALRRRGERAGLARLGRIARPEKRGDAGASDQNTLEYTKKYLKRS